MKDYQQRVVAVKEDLGVKIKNLTNFMHSDAYAELPSTDQGLLMVQLVAMNCYFDALKRRIERF